jgi:zinc protease
MTSATRRVSLVVCGFALALGLVAGCRKKAAETRFKLDNGLRVELAPMTEGDQVALVVLFDVGADHDPPGRSGMAHLVERLFATAGREGKPDRTVQTRTGADFTFYGLSVAPPRLDDEIDDTVMRLSTLAPTEADLARERPRLLEQVAQMQERDAMMAATTKASEAVRPSAGNGVRGGIASEIQAMTLPEIEAFRRAHYGAATARLVIAGRFDLDEVSKRVRAAFSSVPAGKPPQARPPAGSRVTGTQVMGDLPSAVVLAVPVPEPKDPSYAAFVVLATRVSTHMSPGQTWKANFAPFARPDTLLITSIIPPNQPPEPFAEKMRADVSALVKAPLAADDADHAVMKFGGVLGLRPAATALETAFSLGRRRQLGIDAAALDHALHAVTAAQLAAAGQLFDTKSSVAVLAGGKS